MCHWARDTAGHGERMGTSSLSETQQGCGGEACREPHGFSSSRLLLSGEYRNVTLGSTRRPVALAGQGRGARPVLPGSKSGHVGQTRKMPPRGPRRNWGRFLISGMHAQWGRITPNGAKIASWEVKRILLFLYINTDMHPVGKQLSVAFNF